MGNKIDLADNSDIDNIKLELNKFSDNMLLSYNVLLY